MKLIVAFTLTLLLIPAAMWAQDVQPERKSAAKPAKAKSANTEKSANANPERSDDPKPEKKEAKKKIRYHSVEGPISTSGHATKPPVPALPPRAANYSVLVSAGSLKGGLVQNDAQKIDIGKLKSKIEDFLKQKYSSNYRLIGEVSDDAGGAICAAAEHIRNQILKDKWEMINVVTVFYITNAQLRIHLVVSAKTAYGIGTNPPDPSDYKELDTNDLVTYTQEFLTAMSRSLEGK